MKRVIIILVTLSVTLNLTAQRRIDLDTSNFEQIKIFYDKAIKLRNAGRIATCTGVSMFAVGSITSLIILSNSRDEDWDTLIMGLIPAAIGVYIGIPIAVVGIPVWITGSIKKSHAEIAIKKFNTVPENSMALGLGIRFRF